MSKSKEKLQQFSSSSPSSSPSPTTTKLPTSAPSSSSIIEYPAKQSADDQNKKTKDDEISKMKRNSDQDIDDVDDDEHDRHHMVKKEHCGGNNNSKVKTIEYNRNRKKLKDVNDVITCFLCDGYYIEATTINECLHSFCRSCIVQYLQKSKYCPKCKLFNKSLNITNLRADTALRSLVYKLVPGLCQSEIQRLVKFNSASSSVSSLTSPPVSPGAGGTDINNGLWDFYSPDEMISLSLEYHIHSVIGEQDDTSSISQIRYLKCPAAVTVHHLQRFISSKFNLKPASKFSIEIIYEDEILPEDFSLMDVAYCYNWERLSPMQFFYRIFVKPEKATPKPVAKCKKVQSVCEQPSPGDDTESSQRVVTTPTTTIVSTNNNNFSNNETANNSDSSNKNISNNDDSNVNNGDSNDNNNNESCNNIKVESNEKPKFKDIKKEIQDVVVQVKKENNNNNSKNTNNNNNDSISNSNNKIPNKLVVPVSPPQPPNDFKILRSNDIRYAITPTSVDRPIDVSPKKSNGEKRSKLSIKIERTLSHDDYNNNSSKPSDDVIASSPTKRRASASNSITLKRKYNKTDDEDDSSTKKSRSHHHHHHHQKYEIVQSPKIFDDNLDVAESSQVPKIKLDLPNLKAKIKVPKLELTAKSGPGGLKSPSVTSSSSSNSSSPRCNNDDVFIENQPKTNVDLLSTSFSSTDQTSSSHHHKHHHGESSSSHKKRKKSKHSKDSPTDEMSSNGSGNNGYSSNGNSKKRKIHAEISPQTEKSQDDLKLKFKINYKPAEKPKPPIIPTMVIDDDSSDKIVKTPTSPRIVMTLPVPPPIMPSVSKQAPSPPLNTSAATFTTCSLILPKPSIISSMPTLISTNMTIPTPTISNSISQDVEEVIKRNKIKKSNIDMPHRMSPNTEEILNEMRAIHSATQTVPKPMVNIPHLSQVHLQNNDPIYSSKSPDSKNSNPMLVSIRNPNPITVTSPSAMRHQMVSNSRPQMNFTMLPGRQHKTVGIKPPPFTFSAQTFANNTYPRTPFPLPKSISSRKSCYDIDPIDKRSPQKLGPSPSVFDFPSEPSSDFYTKKEKNQKRSTPPTLFDEPFSSIISSMTKSPLEMRGKNVFPVTATTTTTTSSAQSAVKSEPAPFISSIGNSFISENQNSRTPIQPIQLPPASVSVTNVTNKVASNQLQNQQHLKHNSADSKPVVEILRIQSSTPAVDQQVQPQKVKPNRPPPPLIKRPQVIGVSNAGNQQRRTSASSTASDVKKVDNTPNATSSPKVKRKPSSETKEPPMCDNIGALDLSGKSSRSPSLEKSPISKSSSRSNSTEDESFFTTTNPSTSTTTPPKISLSKQKKITDMFPSSAWSVKVENNGSMNISSSDRATAGKSEITITSTTTPTTPLPVSNKPPPPKLTEISKLRTYSNSTKSIPTSSSATTITSVRQQNLSIRNVPNPSALAFRNQMSPNPNPNNNSGSGPNNSNPYNGNSGNSANNNKAKVSEGKEIEKVIAHLKANAAADSGSKTVPN